MKNANGKLKIPLAFGTRDRLEANLSLKLPIITRQTDLVRQISENVPPVPDFPKYGMRPNHCNNLANPSRYMAASAIG
jgi:hypothetical protein